MSKLFSFKKLSWKFTFIIGAFVVIVAGAIALFMESRIISEMDQYKDLNLRHQIVDMEIEANLAFTDAKYGALSLKSFAEANFDTSEYQRDAENYFDNIYKPSMDGFVSNTIANSDFIFAAYFAVHPDLAGFPLVREVFWEETDNGEILSLEPQTYEEYMQTASEDMEWFYGAYSSGAPYWTSIYTWDDGTVMVSYVEPVYAGGKLIGVAGADISINYIEKLVKDAKIYDTGFFAIRDSHGAFFETNAVIKGLNSRDRDDLAAAARQNRNSVFEARVSGVNYYGTSVALVNDYDLLLLAPKSEVDTEAVASVIRFVILFAVVLPIALIIAYFIGKSMSKPLVAISVYLKRAASTGNLKTQPEDADLTGKYIKIKDETGQAIRDCFAFVDHINELSVELESLAQGDLTTEVEVVSDDDVIGKSLKNTFDSLNSLFMEISESTAQVTHGSKQIADGSHALAQGTTQQAASVEQLSASVSEIARKTKDNADMAGRAAALAGTIKGNAEKGSRQMDEMMAAVQEINQASQSISKVIKVIDEIAFQTNILALNAAVEAARAGQHGKGFAVVAEEVRSLAAKSADAAHDTGRLIANSMEKAELGSRIATETATSLADIVSGIIESTKIVSEIAHSSEQQADGIAQINHGIDQVAHVIRQNSATAEESAAASQEMSGQSNILEELISQFKLKGGSGQRFSRPAPRAALPENTPFTKTGGEFGKY